MKKHVMLAVCALVAACDTPTGPTAMAPQYAPGGGNPHFSADATGCTASAGSVACAFKLVGLGKNAEAEVTLTVEAREVYACANPQGKITRGHGEKVRLGSAVATYRSDKNGSIANRIAASVTWVNQFGSRPCPTGHSIVENSIQTETLWQLGAVGQNKSNWWTTVYEAAL